MFVVDHEDDSVYQWSLSTAFDLSSTVTFRGTLNMLSDYQSHSADTSSKTERAQDLEFNNDGSNAKVLEITGDGTVGEYGVLNILSLIHI